VARREHDGLRHLFLRHERLTEERVDVEYCVNYDVCVVRAAEELGTYATTAQLMLHFCESSALLVGADNDFTVNA
jgi:hypothetical protein